MKKTLIISLGLMLSLALGLEFKTAFVSEALAVAQPGAVESGSVEATAATHSYQAQVLELKKDYKPEDRASVQSGAQTWAEIKFLTGPRADQTDMAQLGLIESKQAQLQPGQKVVVQLVTAGQGQHLVITDYLRYPALLVLTVVFVVAVLVVSRLKGLSSLLSLLLTFALVFKLVLPLLSRGTNPILVTGLTAALIIPLTFYLSHGWQNKTHVAVAGTVLALLVSALLANLFVHNSHLTGFSSEEAGFLSVEQSGQINIQGLLLAGMIIGLLGTLDDVTVTQSGLVFQLKKNNPDFSLSQLYQQAMKIGQDHISSMINTLVLVYAGAALPLLLLFINNPQPLWLIFNQEIVAEEIVRMLIGSIGLMLAAPVTTLLAVLVASNKELRLLE
jgi:uncharacterized membrane protein